MRIVLLPEKEHPEQQRKFKWGIRDIFLNELVDDKRIQWEDIKFEFHGGMMVARVLHYTYVSFETAEIHCFSSKDVSPNQ